MRAVVAIAVLVTGCLSVNLSSGANTGLGHSPNRVVSAQYGFGTYVKIKDAVVLEPSFNFMLGPLGKKAESVVAFGLRAITHSHGLRPGYFGSFLAAGSGSDFEHPQREIIARLYRVGGGVSWDGHSYLDDDDDHWWYDSFGVIAVGVFYTHESQDDIGAGDFLGIELSVTGGFSVQQLVYGLTDGNPDAH